MNKLKGDNYENYILQYLINIQKYDKAWLWKNIPEKILFEENIILDYNNYSYVRNDIGIDILAAKDNEYHYIQCKNYENTICIEDLAGYYFFKDIFKKKCRVYYNGKLSNRIQYFCKGCDEFINVPFINDMVIPNNNEEDFNSYETREYQIDCYNLLKDKIRGVISLPCGMGKTYISCLLSSNYDNIIFFAPTKELAMQSANTLNKYFPNYNCILISSDGTRDNDKIILKSKNILASTYKSCDIINKLITKLTNPYIIIDEFHNLSQNDLSNKNNEFYNLLHSDYRILFLSATPKYLDNKKVFGNTIYKYSWIDAIRNKFINDFEIFLPTAEYTDIEFEKFIELFKIKNMNQNNGNTNYVKKMYFILRSLFYNGNKKCIIYLDNTKVAMDCSNTIEWMKILFNKNINASIIDYKTDKKTRRNILNNFTNDTELNIILNVHVMDEGINIPSCDSVFITNPSDNIHNIVQRMSRCNRIYKNKDKSYIYLWCNEDKSKEILDYINNNTNNEFNGKFKKLDLGLNRIVDYTNIKKDFDIKDIDKINNHKNNLRDNKYVTIESNTQDSKYYCKLCNYKTDNRSAWYIHKKSQKHWRLGEIEKNKQENNINKNKIVAEITNQIKKDYEKCINQYESYIKVLKSEIN